MKKVVWSLIVSGILLIVGAFILGRYALPNTALSELPKPEVTSGQRGELGIDKNINETNIDNYLGRSDSIYRDMRMLKDPAEYEKVGGDSYLSVFVDGFEVVPLPYVVNVTGLPDPVGTTYEGKTLFTNSNGVYTPNYKESMQILEALFPKDKTIFLMCGGASDRGIFDWAICLSEYGIS